jgi:predicted PurR-regulated permease PerM
LGADGSPPGILVVLLAALVLGGVVTLVAFEVTSLAGELPTYTGNVKKKIKSLRQAGHGTDRLEKMIQDIMGEWELKPANLEEAETQDKPAVAVAPEKQSAVVVQPESPAWLSRLPAFFTPVAQLIGGLALALVLVVFMLLKRENLRNRLIRLVGHGRMTVTTKARGSPALCSLPGIMDDGGSADPI